MKIIVEVRLSTDSEETILAHETAHVTMLTHTQTVLAARVASCAVGILAGDKVLTRPIVEHLAVD